MLTRPNVSEPFQIAAISYLLGILTHTQSMVCMEATHMPPVENHLCDAEVQEPPALPDGFPGLAEESRCGRTSLDKKAKAPRGRGFFFRELRSANLGYVCGLRSFLSLDDLELDLIAL